ncbi:hypothetical protein Q7C36_017035 [Tachysurus vachellii]|uniref:Uncharacterized protein n=1 Tax=Tachysurus vachellii TaxID=175792 RepID=A0AA88SCL5_TACVA|nr:hypothetical protein Q7C36_017035 [Tachysurus vachellii]
MNYGHVLGNREDVPFTASQASRVGNQAARSESEKCWNGEEKDGPRKNKSARCQWEHFFLSSVAGVTGPDRRVIWAMFYTAACQAHLISPETDGSRSLLIVHSSRSSPPPTTHPPQHPPPPPSVSHPSLPKSRPTLESPRHVR